MMATAMGHRQDTPLTQAERAERRLNCFHNKAQECGYTPGPLLFHGSITVSVLFVDCKMGLAIHTITPAAGWASV